MQLRERRSVQSFGESQQDGQEQRQQSLMLRLAGQAVRTLWLPSINCHLLRCPGASFLNLLVKISETHILKAAPSDVESIVSGIVGSKEFKSKFLSPLSTMPWLNAAISLREGYCACDPGYPGWEAVKNGHHIWPRPTSITLSEVPLPLIWATAPIPCSCLTSPTSPRSSHSDIF